jgi:hypothetical protein
VKIDLLSGDTVTARLPGLGGRLTDAVQNGAAVNEANFHPNPQSRKTGGWSFPREMF